MAADSKWEDRSVDNPVTVDTTRMRVAGLVMDVGERYLARSLSVIDLRLKRKACS